MFIGHYGVSLAAKRWAPGLSLGWLFVAVQTLDVVFAVFVLAGIEKMNIVPGFTAYNSYDLYFMPYSHGLMGALGWSLLVALLARGVLGRGRAGAAVVIGICVFSHWLLDVPMHTADMPISGDHSMKVGLGLWRNRNLSLVAELIALATGVVVWLRRTGGIVGSRVVTISFLGVLTAALLATPFIPPPSGPVGFAISALVSYVAFAAAAAWVDRRRVATPGRAH